MQVISAEPYYQTTLGHLYQGDCLGLLPQIGDGSVDLFFADPPFNLGKNYGKGIDDALADQHYLDWCRRWIDPGMRVLRPGGAFYLWNLPKWNVELGHALNEHGMLFRHWIAVPITYTLPLPGRLYPAHYSLLYFTKGKPRTFNRPRVPIPVCRHCGGDLKDYGGHRNKLNPEGLNLSDVWTDIPPVRHKSTKVRGANALSIKLMRRVLEISSQPGDWVLDPFGGSGTTYVAAEEMHRHWLGIEIGDCDPIVGRLKGEPPADVMPRRGDAAKGMRAMRSTVQNVLDDRVETPPMVALPLPLDGDPGSSELDKSAAIRALADGRHVQAGLVELDRDHT
jgi:site-specific DNA-methyltransferase (adenine-specific)